MQDRLQKLGQDIARSLWLKHRSSGPCRFVACLAELALDVAEQDEFSRALLRAVIVSLEQLRSGSDTAQARFVH